MERASSPRPVGPTGQVNGLLSLFVRHPNAANLLMILCIIAGLFSVRSLNTQFFPNFIVDRVTVTISWPGASAEDVEANILAAVEPQLRFLDDVKQLDSVAREGGASLTIEYEEGTDLKEAEADIETALDGITTLPEDSEDPDIVVGRFFDRVADITIHGPFPESTVREYAKRMRDDLLNRGVDRVTFTGLRDEEIHVVVSEQDLVQLGMTVGEISTTLRDNTRDLPSGDLEGAVDRQLRTLAEEPDPRDLRDIEIMAFETGERVTLGDIGDVKRTYDDDMARGLVNGNPAISLRIERAENSDALELSAVVDEYLEEARQTFPASLEIVTDTGRTDALLARIQLLIKNGLGGLVLVIAVLFIFLNGRVAFWVTAGIPVAIAATLAVMLLLGQSINMVSLFALLMMLGIIVDDAIVVGEHTATRIQAGDSAEVAAERGAGRMFMPVVAASLTTAAAFAPILLIGDVVGQIMGVIPIVVVCTLIASLIECFLILPGHLAHSLKERVKRRWSPWRQFFVSLLIAGLATSALSANGAVLGEIVRTAVTGPFPFVEASGVFASWWAVPSWVAYVQDDSLLAVIVTSLVNGVQTVVTPILASIELAFLWIATVCIIVFSWMLFGLAAFVEGFVAAAKWVASFAGGSDGTDGPPLTFFAAIVIGIAAFLTGTAIEFAFYLNTFISRSREPGRENFVRRGFDAAFAFFRDYPFTSLLKLSFHWRYVTLALCLASMLVFAIGVVRGGKIGFSFFPSPEAESITANVVLNAGIPRPEALEILAELEQSARALEDKLGDGERFIEGILITYGQNGQNRGQAFAEIKVDLTVSEVRSVRTPLIVKTWRESAPDIPGIKSFSITQRRGGAPGRDVDIQLQGASPENLKRAAIEVTSVISAIPGLTGVADTLPFGKPEVVLELNERGRTLGFTIDSVGNQVRGAFEGAIARLIPDGDDEVTLKVKQKMNFAGLASLRDFQLRSPTGNFVPLGEVVEIHQKQGFSSLIRTDGKLTVSVQADIDGSVTTTQDVIDELEETGAIRDIASKYGATYRYDGKDKERADAFADLQTGIIVALMVMYIILAWIFGSYTTPFAVMLIIPFGVVGAVVGHYLLGFKLTILSLVGMLGLSGILVNDSIILVSRFQERLREGESFTDAAIGASRDRLRAVLLTSLSTIGGLTPLMFEESRQAQFLLPMVITIVFGLAYATILVLFLVPAFLGIGNDIRRFFKAVFYGRDDNELIVQRGDDTPTGLEPRGAPVTSARTQAIAGPGP
ncbi:MAG: efflux RND transporter permease subunit [Pseudomonadota bacterium]